MRRFFALLLLCAGLALALPPAASAAPMEAVLSDTFDVLDGNVWNPHFYLWSGSAYGPSTGTTSAAGGIATLRPAVTRGTSVLESKSVLITGVPARVSFDIRFSGSSYREADMELASAPRGTDFSAVTPWIRWDFGKTNHLWDRNPYLELFDSEGGYASSEQTGTGSVLPSDTWLSGEMYLYPDRVTTSINGVNLTTYGDVETMASEGGFYLLFATFDDGSRSGFDIDNLLVEQAPTTGHISGTVRNLDGDPLAGIDVFAWRQPEADGESPEMTTQTVTAADGSYELTTTVAGWYTIAYDDPTDTYRDQTFFRGGVPIGSSGMIWVDASEEATGVDTWMTPLSWLRTHRAVRVSGASRYDTALAISQANFGYADTVVLATGAGFADATAASPLSGAYHAPLLLTPRDTLPTRLIPELRRLGTTRVLVVGGSAAVSDGVLATLQANGFTVERISGADRYGTAAAIVRYLIDHDFPMPAEPFVVRGDNFPDALAVSPFAYQQVRPVLLVRPTSAPPVTVAVLSELGAVEVYVVGSELAVSDDALIDLAAGTPEGVINYSRISGTNRYQTALELAKAWVWPYDSLGIATGVDFPDALTGGIAQGENWGALLLSPPTTLDPGVAGLVAQNGLYLWPVQLYGSTRALSDTVLAQTAAAAGSSFLEFEESFGVLSTLKASALKGGARPRTREAAQQAKPNVAVRSLKKAVR